MPDTPQDTHCIERKSLFLDCVSTLHNALVGLRADLDTVEHNEYTNGVPHDDRAYLDALACYVRHQFNLVCDIADSNPQNMYDGTISYGPKGTTLTVENVHDDLTAARSQFESEVSPSITTLLDDPDADTTWRRFYGGGVGWSYQFTISGLVDRLTDDIRETAEDIGLDPDQYAPARGTAPASDSSTATNTEPTDGAAPSSLELPNSDTTETPPPSPDVDETDEAAEDSPSESEREPQTDADVVNEQWPGYDGDLIYTPEGTPEPLADDARLSSAATITSVEYSGVMEPPCKNQCDFAGRYLITMEDRLGNRTYARTCSSCIPDAARGIAPNFDLWKEGVWSNEGELVSTLKVANGENYSWRENHVVSDGSNEKPGDLLAYIKYELTNGTIYISVQDGVSEHGREGNYSVDVDKFDGAIPYVEGKPIREWLLSRARQHRTRLLENEGVERHLVSIDRDMRVIARAQRAYRDQNPDFEHPPNTINDHTPVVEDCITVCADCGEIVAGTSLENAEACEYCGCTDAVWMGDLRDDPDADDTPEQAA